MSDPIDVREGRWTDDQGRQCLGVWADEGGQLLILRREDPRRVSFHVTEPMGRGRHSATISSFRWERIRDFLQGGS